MFFKQTLTISLLVLAASARQGGVAIYNDCAHTVYSDTVMQGSSRPTEAIKPNSWHWTPYQYPQNGGVSMKLRKTPALFATPITQLEYTIASDGLIYYDISNVDCGPTSTSNQGACPFVNGGMFLHTTKGCSSKRCKGGDVRCHDAYNFPKDDWATAGCKFKNQSLVLYVCRDRILGGRDLE
jgi:hypothetical protein